MITIRRSNDRGHFDYGWLDTRHTFSFGRYVDRDHVEFRGLRVINEDLIAPGRGFGTHPHEEMEIISYVADGVLAHRDSTGGQGEIRPGEVQVMTAGTGLEHSEFNPSGTAWTHLLQIWVRPRRSGAVPGYRQRAYPEVGRRDRLATLVAPTEQAEALGALGMEADAYVLGTLLTAGAGVERALGAGRAGWVQVVRGEVSVNGTVLSAGDGAALEGEPWVRVVNTGAGDAEVLVFDLA
jgi:redox-sensitive bicupin YhaK (pirin superfamily)